MELLEEEEPLKLEELPEREVELTGEGGSFRRGAVAAAYGFQTNKSEIRVRSSVLLTLVFLV
jgi:hypothetical protein